jgi:hypothetical protein
LSGDQTYEVPYTYSGGAAGCTGLAQRRSGEVQVSFAIPFPTVVGEHQTQWIAVVNPYMGPGTYSSNLIVPLSLAVDPSKKGPKFEKTAQTKAVATIAKDASGTLTFSALAAKNGQTESGTIKWSCLG